MRRFLIVLITLATFGLVSALAEGTFVPEAGASSGNIFYETLDGLQNFL